MVKKLIGIAVVAIMLFGVLGLTGCGGGAMKISDFEGLDTLPRSPSRLVFATDFQEGLPMNIEIPSEDIEAVMDRLFARTYKKMAKHINIDVLNESLIVYDQVGTQWTVPIGVIHDNGRWHDPNQDDLRSMLYEITNTNK